MDFLTEAVKQMRIEGKNPYSSYNAGQNSTRRPEKTAGDHTVRQSAAIEVEIMPKTADGQPLAEAERLFKNEPQSTYEQLRQQFEMMNEQSKSERDKLKILLTCMEIARRISGGDTVPAKDHEFLLKHDSALYARAILMRFPKNNPHQYKRLSWDEDCQDGLSAAALKQSFNHALESCHNLNNALAQGIVSAIGS